LNATTASPEREARRFLPAWRLGLSAASLAALAGLLLTAPTTSVAVAAALVLTALPGLAGVLMQRLEDERFRAGELVLWAVCGGAAAGLTGGVGGPLAAWCLAPLAASVAMNRRKLVSAGGAWSLAATAAALWAAFSGLFPAPSADVSIWLGFVSIAALTTAFAVAAVRALRARTHQAQGAREDAHEAASAERRLETLLAEQPHLVFTVDLQGRVGAAFGAAPPGVTAGALFEHGLIGVADHPDRGAVQAALLKAAAQGAAEVGFTPRAAYDRHVTAALRRMADGRLAAILRDSTVAHAREGALAAAKAEAEAAHAGKSRFLAEMSHELRTPLNAVIGFSDIMRQRLFGPLPDRYAEYAQAIHESGGHLLDLINDVLDLSKIEAQRFELAKERFDGREPVSSALRVVRIQAHEAGVDLRGVLPSDPVPVEADRRAIKQIVLNLLSNALKFTPRGGSVTVTAEATDGRFELTVADTGVGVAPEDLERLGRPYEQAGDGASRAKGTGLGLSLVRAFAELHGGDMAIESTLGAGTAVVVRLPVLCEDEAGRGIGGAEIIPLNLAR
jgi:cell cycle sensor histidine kinase DivJ